MLLIGGTCLAGPHAPTPNEFRRIVSPFVTKYCVECHNDEDSEGNTNLSQFKSLDQLLADRKPWEKVLRQLKAGAMPPDGVDASD